MSDYPEMCPVCHKADADLCFCSKAAQDAAWNRRAQPAAPAEQEISAEEKFCDGHCSWAEHHPDCSLAAPPAQPVAHLWQHGETGRTRIVMPDQIFTADANWLLVGPMYLHPAAAPAECSSCDGTGKISGLPCAWCMQSAAPSVAPEPVAWTLQSELDAAQTTCSAHLWFTNPRNSAWTALFTREKSAAHPPRAPLTEERVRGLVKECGLDWHRGYMPLFDGDPTNRFAVLVEAVEAAHGIGGKGPWVDSETGEQRVTPRPAPHKKPPPFAKGAAK